MSYTVSWVPSLTLLFAFVLLLVVPVFALAALAVAALLLVAALPSAAAALLAMPVVALGAARRRLPHRESAPSRRPAAGRPGTRARVPGPVRAAAPRAGGAVLLSSGPERAR